VENPGLGRRAVQEPLQLVCWVFAQFQRMDELLCTNFSEMYCTSDMLHEDSIEFSNGNSKNNVELSDEKSHNKKPHQLNPGFCCLRLQSSQLNQRHPLKSH
jgi:hypothetical protein